MPRAQDFSNSTIYHIRHIETKKVIYVGSSTSFMNRKRKHKYNCTNPKSVDKDIPIYQYIRDNGGWDLYEVIPVLQLSLENNIQLLIQEQKEMDKHDTLINCKNAKEDTERRVEHNKQWHIDNKERMTEFKKEWYQDNKERITEYYKEKITCDCGCIVTRSSISKHLKSMKHQNLLKI